MGLSVEEAWDERSIYIRVHELVDGREDILVTRDIFKGVRTVFFNPANTISILTVPSTRRGAYQGRLSSASTGKLAALLFPFELVLSELNIISSRTGGASISISSS